MPDLLESLDTQGEDSREEDLVSTFETIVSISVAVIAACNVITTFRG